MDSQCPQLTEEQSKSVALLLCSLHKSPFNALLGTKYQLCICILIINLGTLRTGPPKLSPKLFPKAWCCRGHCWIRDHPPGIGSSIGARAEMDGDPAGAGAAPGAAQPRVLWAPEGLECLHGLPQQRCHPGNAAAPGRSRGCVCWGSLCASPAGDRALG